MKGSGQSAIVVARNRFAVLNKWAGAPSPFYHPFLISLTVMLSHDIPLLIEFRDFLISIVRSIKPPVQTNEILYSSTANLILSSNTSVVLYEKTIAD